jgi:hypothetical protein
MIYRLVNAGVRTPRREYSDQRKAGSIRSNRPFAAMPWVKAGLWSWFAWPAVPGAA